MKNNCEGENKVSRNIKEDRDACINQIYII